VGVGLAWFVLSGTAAAYGFSKVSQCGEAKRMRDARYYPPGPPAPPPVAGPLPRRRHRLAWLWVALLVVFMAGLSLDIVRSWQRMNAPKVIPSWAGMSYDAASGQARGMGFRVVRSDASSPVAAGQVLATSPAAGGKLKRGKTVTFNVSLGNQEQVPDVAHLGALPLVGLEAAHLAPAPVQNVADMVGGIAAGDAKLGEALRQAALGDRRAVGIVGHTALLP